MAEPKGTILAKGKFANSPRHMISTSMFIREHLIEHGEDYITHMWRAFCAVKAEKNVKPGSYRNFRSYIYWLTKLHLIEVTRTEPASRPLVAPRRFYRLVSENINKLDLWRSPRRMLYPRSWKNSHKRRG